MGVYYFCNNSHRMQSYSERSRRGQGRRLCVRSCGHRSEPAAGSSRPAAKLRMSLFMKPVAVAHSLPYEPETRWPRSRQQMTAQSVTLPKGRPLRWGGAESRDPGKLPACRSPSRPPYLHGQRGWVVSWRCQGQQGSASLPTTLTADGEHGASGSYPGAPERGAEVSQLPAGKNHRAGQGVGSKWEGMKCLGSRSHEAKHCLNAYCVPDFCRHTGYLSEQNRQHEC